jgi:2-C-methyl-D-erythritol 4-phosphate cytidylyltransferase
VRETLDREALWSAETPQAFRLAALERAQQLAADAGELDAATDEAWLIERSGGTVLLEESRTTNLKVTTDTDLAAAAALIAAAESR